MSPEPPTQVFVFVIRSYHENEHLLLGAMNDGQPTFQARRLGFLPCPLAILLRHEPLQFGQGLGL